MSGQRRQGLWPDGVGRHPSGSLLDLAARWDVALEVRQFSPETRRAHRSQIGLFLAWLAEREITQAAQVTRSMIEVYQRHLFRLRRPDGRALSASSQHGRLASLVVWFRWAVRQGHLPANPASDLEYPRLPQPLPEPLTPQELAAALGAADLTTPAGLRERTAMEIMYSTGLRRAELVRLDLTDIDPVRGVVRVIAGKGRKDRLVPIGKRALAWFDRYLREARPRFCGAGSPFRIFLQGNGTACTPGMLGGRIWRIMRAAGVTKQGACHLFRHTMASQLLEAGCDVAVIGQLLGHTDLHTTMRYTRIGVLGLCRLHAAFHPGESSCQTGSGQEDGEAACVPEEPANDAAP